MNAEHKHAIRDSMERLDGSAQELVETFYRILFDLAPETRALFRGDMNQQAQKLMQTLAKAIEMLDDQDKLACTLRVLGAHHHAIGVKRAHYGVVATAMLQALSRAIRDWSPTDARAWTKLLGDIAEQMIAGAEAAETGTNAA